MSRSMSRRTALRLGITSAIVAGASGLAAKAAHANQGSATTEATQNTPVQAYAVIGAIRAKWLELGGPNGYLGLPLDNEHTTPNKSGWYQHFQGGSLYCQPDRPAFAIRGAIRDKWASLGWERSPLGFPTSDEMILPGRIYQSNFEGGSISWTQMTGAVVKLTTRHFRDQVVTQDWAPIGGWVDIVVDARGNFTFAGHMHDSGFPNIDYALAAVIMTANGIGYGFTHEGNVDGTVTFFGRDRDDDWINTGANPQVAENWDQVAQGRLFWRLVARDTLSKGVMSLLEDVAKEAVKAVGAAAVKGLIALV